MSNKYSTLKHTYLFPEVGSPKVVAYLSSAGASNIAYVQANNPSGTPSSSVTCADFNSTWLPATGATNTKIPYYASATAQGELNCETIPAKPNDPTDEDTQAIITCSPKPGAAPSPGYQCCAGTKTLTAILPGGSTWDGSGRLVDSKYTQCISGAPGQGVFTCDDRTGKCMPSETGKGKDRATCEANCAKCWMSGRFRQCYGGDSGPTAGCRQRDNSWGGATTPEGCPGCCGTTCMDAGGSDPAGGRSAGWCGGDAPEPAPPCIGSSTLLRTENGIQALGVITPGTKIVTWNKVNNKEELKSLLGVFTHGETNEEHLELLTDTGDRIVLSHYHYIYLSDGSMVHGKTVKVGDELKNNIVIQINTIQDIPLTPVLVNGTVITPSGAIISSWSGTKENAELMDKLVQLFQGFASTHTVEETANIIQMAYEEFRLLGKNLEEIPKLAKKYNISLPQTISVI